MKKVVFTLLLLVILIPMQAQTSQEIYQFLRLPVSAHAAALGGDNITLIEDDAPLMFNNPALLGSVSDKTLNFNYMNYMSGVNYGSASFTRIIREATTIAAGVQFINYGRMRQTDENGVQIGEFSANEIAFSGVFSYELSERFIASLQSSLLLISVATIHWRWGSIWESTITIPTDKSLFRLWPKTSADS
mgnify:CR=1 FL=1